MLVCDQLPGKEVYHLAGFGFDAYTGLINSFSCCEAS